MVKTYRRKSMKLYRSIFIFFFALALSLIPVKNVFAGLAVIGTDTFESQLAGFFDLRDRESFIQVTHTDAVDPTTFHIQIFNVGNLCNENNFFDAYTPNDTHVYNLRDIVTNDGTPSGVVLPDDAYGIFVATDIDFNDRFIGNLRILDDNGYEYRTNLNGVSEHPIDSNDDVYTFNYNTEGGVTLSDVVGIMLDFVDLDEVRAADILNIWASFDIDIFDLNEVPFSCRDVNFACVNQDNPQLESLLEQINNGGVGNQSNNNNNGSGNVASFEYGINESIPSSKDVPLLCPGNVISEGFVQLRLINYAADDDHAFALFVGLNNGNERGSMDVMWQDNCLTEGFGFECEE